MLLYNICVYLDIIVYIILVVYGWKYYGLSGFPLRVFLWIISLSCLIQLVTLILADLRINNLILFHFLFLAQLIGYPIFYSSILKGKYARGIIITGLALCIVVSIWDYYNHWGNLFNIFGGYAYFSVNVLFVVLSVYYLLTNIGDNQEDDYRFINYGTIVYSGGSAVFFLFGKKLLELNADDQIVLWIFNVVIHLIFLGFYSLQLWRTRRLSTISY